MKRYTGQQALYEAISRSRAKAKQGSILEKLRPEHSKPENQAAKPTSQAEPETPVESASEASSEPQVVETPQQPTVEHTPQAEPRTETPSEPVVDGPAELNEPIVRPRPIETVVRPVPASPVQTWLKPRPVQFNEGRIEISVPYHVGAIAGLVLLLVILAAYRLGGSGGQANGAPPAQPVAEKSAVANPPAGPSTRNAAADSGRPLSPAASAAGGRDVVATGTQGDNWIVLVEYKRSEDFTPVIKHFQENGIELGVMPLDSESRKAFAALGYNANVLPPGPGFLLVTRSMYSNPKVAGTDGYKMLQKIVEVGAKYKGKAPSGYETFAPKYFSDAYPMKITP